MKLQTLVQLKNLLENTVFFAVPMRWADVRDQILPEVWKEIKAQTATKLPPNEVKE